MIYNVAFDGARLQYGVEYENALGYSGIFQEYQQALVKRVMGANHPGEVRDALDEARVRLHRDLEG